LVLQHAAGLNCAHCISCLPVRNTCQDLTGVSRLLLFLSSKRLLSICQAATRTTENSLNSQIPSEQVGGYAPDEEERSDDGLRRGFVGVQATAS
jgi:hypothetical protein